MKRNTNTKLVGTEHAICRSPLFSLDTTFEQAWPQLKRIIGDTAPDFYPFIAELEASEVDLQPEKIRFTLWKYYNRSRYRSTPFGEFAAVSLVENAKGAGTCLPIVIQKNMEVQQWPDWNAAPSIAYDNKMLRGAVFRTNPSCYAYGGEYRYLHRDEQGFTLNVVPQRDDISLLVGYCEKRRSFQEISDHLCHPLAVDKRGLLSLLKQLLELQVLECDLQPNITGEDYFERRRIMYVVGNNGYRLASRKVLSGGLSPQLYRGLAEYATFMGYCLGQASNPMLEQFKTDFMHTWEQQGIPLSLALDPIMGIGYGRNGELPQSSLAGELQGRPTKENSSRISYGPFEQFLLSRMVQGRPVQLAEYIPAPQTTASTLPNTLSILFHLFEDRAVLHHAGGASGTSLLGRFTPIQKIHDYALSLAAIEEAANPEVLFFDLAYQCEGYTDNVNRRRSLYETELAIGSWSTHDSPLRLDDIMVSIRGGKIILYHRESGRRLVPRLASAYNHKRSDLDLFRFLCDLQYQEALASLSFDLSMIFPGLDSYPRTYFRDIITSPAKWLLPICKDRNELESWLQKQNITTLFTIGDSDQTLTIDPSSSEDLDFLLLYQRQKGAAAYISEALIGSEGAVRDIDGKNYHCQFISHVQHGNTCYESIPFRKETTVRRDLRMPGSEWLYMELYMCQAIMDNFLDHEVRILLRSQREAIREWFFIRYNHPDHHIRLRIKLRDPANLPGVLQEFQKLMNIQNEYGQVRRMEIKGYERELSRYGQPQMDMVEHFFHLDSVLAMKQLRYPTEVRYREILEFVRRLTGVLYTEHEAQLGFYKGMAASYATEMSFSHADFKRINNAYRGYNETSGHETNVRLLHCFEKLIPQYSSSRQRELLADLIHLHINRRFNGAQRLHEAIIYQYLYRSAQRRQHA